MKRKPEFVAICNYADFSGAYSEFVTKPNHVAIAVDAQDGSLADALQCHDAWDRYDREVHISPRWYDLDVQVPEFDRTNDNLTAVFLLEIDGATDWFGRSHSRVASIRHIRDEKPELSSLEIAGRLFDTYDLPQSFDMQNFADYIDAVIFA